MLCQKICIYVIGPLIIYIAGAGKNCMLAQNFLAKTDPTFSDIVCMFD